MRTGFKMITLLSLILIMAGAMLMEDTRGNTMSVTDHEETAHSVLPPIDKDIPAVIETATFALG